jgi:enoyl-CoA hydratase
VRLQRQIPTTIAADILLTGRHISGQEAKEIGLVGYVVPDGAALEKAREIAGLIAANGPLAVEAILKTLHDTEHMSEDEAFEYESGYTGTVMGSQDSKEGPRAFAEKRAPNFQRK